MVIVFPFLRTGLANIPPTFFYLMRTLNKVLKNIKVFWAVHLRPFTIWIWIWLEFGFVLNMMLFLIFPALPCATYQSHSLSLSYHFYHKIQTLNFQTVNLYFYASEILLFTVFINACKLTGELPIDWSFLLGVWHSVNWLSVSVTDWTLSSSSIQWIYL